MAGVVVVVSEYASTGRAITLTSGQVFTGFSSVHTNQNFIRELPSKDEFRVCFIISSRAKRISRLHTARS
jgi:hypothetical protein